MLLITYAWNSERHAVPITLIDVQTLLATLAQSVSTRAKQNIFKRCTYSL